MKSHWNKKEAAKCLKDPLALRVYTSRLLGKEPNLVLHGGGNTSVKLTERNPFGEKEEVVYVKGSGWDLATIEKEGFAPVKLDCLLKMAKLKNLSDTKMVKIQRSAMTDPYAPNPSVEAILHAIIPFKYVDHTHADCVVTVTNTPNGKKRIEEIFGDRVLIVPYVMPGFILAKKIYEMTRNIDWKKIDGLILMKHGVFTFDDDAKKSYERMIHLVSKVEQYMRKKKVFVIAQKSKASRVDLQALAKLRKVVSKARSTPLLASLKTDNKHIQFSKHPRINSIARRGPLTPDHVIRTKRIPAILNGNFEHDVKNYARDYQKYFDRHANGHQKSLDPAPRWAIWPKQGTVSFGKSIKDIEIVSDITDHTIDAILQAETLGGWKALPQKEIFDIEYWELEQAKLKKSPQAKSFQGKIALVTGAASGIGQACARELHEQGAVVVALDINRKVQDLFDQKGILGLKCDVTSEEDLKEAVQTTIRQFGGLDILVSNAGIFPASENIAQMHSKTWQQSLKINLTSHQNLLKHCIPYLMFGIDPVIIIVASKNVPAPGPGASAYSVAKAGLTQLARVAALELGSAGIRVHVIHPNQVFDTGIWTSKVLKGRARQYGMSVDDYKSNNLLKVEITSKDVAELACAMAGPLFSKSTGTQVSIDGGNERVI